MKLFDMLTNEDIKRIKKVEDPAKRIEELEGKCREAGRAMIELNLKWEATLGEVEKLKADLARAKEEHQYDNMVHQKELESLKNPTSHLRKKGLI